MFKSREDGQYCRPWFQQTGDWGGGAIHPWRPLRHPLSGQEEVTMLLNLMDFSTQLLIISWLIFDHFQLWHDLVTVPLKQRFSIPVLAPPRSAYFVCYSYRFRCLLYSNVSALRSGHHRIFLHDSSSKRTYIFHSKCTEVCKTWIKIVYIYRGIWCHTRPCVKTLRSANPWMNVPEIK